ncbi:Pyridoxal-5'-phosphate-dependent protein beta subunit [Pseudovibrio sp. FO-BEG1]|uniref:threonine ammonia-lyase n=1 Tax=Pseudovibrio sp. (strain FO-BEG1) TaxID=911045 RepID=UPI000238CFEB|nr:threonine/serine dehydratase [Pseudovibrio sp. FO-BEG1]AEV36350.1 Pyridoxal-5'-phosphate-dependent protein beta subunit [Pseudovibrio sp. FO-BEG1]
MISLSSIQEAAKRIDSVIINTPLLESDFINKRSGGRILFKPECLQRTGSFKLRGAYNRIAKLTEAERKRGVVAFSSGNHAQGVAAAAAQAGTTARIVMPEDAPAIKIENTRSFGAEVILYDRATGDRAQIAKDIANETGAVMIAPYDDYAIMEGQGTIGLEIIESLRAKGLTTDAVICPAGGGGLLAGTSTAIKALSPETCIYSAEPEGFDDTARSLLAGQRLENAPGQSICDSIVTHRPGELTFPINQRNVTGGLVVTEDDVRLAMKAAFENLKLAIEPGGAAGLAAIMNGQYDCSGKVVVVILSGGNLGAGDFANHLNAAPG